MTYKRFSQLWDALITDNPCVPKETIDLENPAIIALIAYANGDKSHFEKVKKTLGRN